MALLSMSVGKLSGERVCFEVEEHRTVAEVMRLLEMRFDWSPILALVKDGGGQLLPKTRLKALKEGEGLESSGVLHTTVVHGLLQDQCYKHRYGAVLRGPKGLHVMLRDCQWSCELGHEVLQLCASQDTFVALRADGEVLTLNSQSWQDLHLGARHEALKLPKVTIRSLCSTDGAIAALLADGRVRVWGDAMKGGNSEEVQEQLVNIQQISSTRGAFAAFTGDGDVVVWGNRRLGGQLSKEVSKVQQLQANDGAFAVLTEQGTVVCWGSCEHGGDCALQLTSVEEIYSSYKAFSARCADGQIWWWSGHHATPLPGPPLRLGGGGVPVRRVVGSNRAFAAVLSDGRVVQLVSSEVAFTALREDGLLVRWGHPHYTKPRRATK